MGCGAGAGVGVGVGVGVATPVLANATVSSSASSTCTSRAYMRTEKRHALPFNTALPENAKLDAQTTPIGACSEALISLQSWA